MSLHCFKLLMVPCCFYIKVQTFIMIFNTMFLWFLPNSLDSPFSPIVLCPIHTKLSVVPLMHPLFPLWPSLPPTQCLHSLLAAWELPTLPSCSSSPTPLPFHHLLISTYPTIFNCDFTSSELGALPISFLRTITFSLSKVWQPIL